MNLQSKCSVAKTGIVSAPGVFFFWVLCSPVTQQNVHLWLEKNTKSRTKWTAHFILIFEFTTVWKCSLKETCSSSHSPLNLICLFVDLSTYGISHYSIRNMLFKVPSTRVFNKDLTPIHCSHRSSPTSQYKIHIVQKKIWISYLFFLVNGKKYSKYLQQEN